jgi:acetate kinase
MTASLAGLDAIVFTGGVGERSAPVRALAVDGLGYLGLALDAARNEAEDGGADRDIAPEDAVVRALVIAAREDVEIAREVRLALAAAVA